MYKQRTVTNQHSRSCNGIYKTNKWHATGIIRLGSTIRTSQSGREEPQQLGLQPTLNRRRMPSPHQWNDHTKPKTKANASRVPVETQASYRTETTPTVNKLCEYSQLTFISVLQGTMPYTVWAEQNTHLWHCVCTCEQRALLQVCHDGKLVN
jgi:hypothetical protein